MHVFFSLSFHSSKQIDYRKFSVVWKIILIIFSHSSMNMPNFAEVFSFFNFFSSIHNNNNMKGEQNVTSACFLHFASIWLSNTIKSLIFFPQYCAQEVERYLCRVRRWGKEGNNKKQKRHFIWIFRLFSIAPFVFVPFFIACNRL